MTTEAVSTIGVVGAGTMGAGIAQVAAHSGFDVVLVDQAAPWLDRGLETITASLDRLVSKERLTADERDAVLGRIEGATDIGYLAGCDLVIEAVTESFPTKAEVFREVESVVDPETLLATNTSSISISAIGGVLESPDRLVGMHFFNPVPVLALVEVIRGIRTSDSTVAAVTDVARSMGKTPIEIKDSAGFAVNRLLIPMINEAVTMVDEGVASVDDIDVAMTLGASHPMGPLALADLIGLDVCLSIMEVLHADLGENYRPASLLRRMVASGQLGRKSGQGFHTYERT